MHRISPHLQDYAWGSASAIPELLHHPVTGEPVAEAWFGAHPSAPSPLEPTDPAGPATLLDLVDADPQATLGADVVDRFGPHLPFLLKLIAPAAPLSLQVHPTLEQAGRGFVREEHAGIPLTSPERSYRDRNHKPEIVYALTPFEALAGFRAPRKAAAILDGLQSPLAKALREALRSTPGPDGVRSAFELLLSSGGEAGPEAVDELALECAARPAAGTSPSLRADAIVSTLHQAYGGDAGVVSALLLNPVTLQPGESMFVPAGNVHAYLSGFGVEVMANSDNVIRAGLTPKHVDVTGLLEIVDYVAAPPIRIAPERALEHVDVFYAPVDDFELAVTHVYPGRSLPLSGGGPRVVVVLTGEATLVDAAGQELTLARGQGAFLPADGDGVHVRGAAMLAQAGVP